MTGQGAVLSEIDSFLDSWEKDQQPLQGWCRYFYQQLAALDGVVFDFAARPGISYSIRPRHINQTGRDLFAIIDVIDDEPQQRWLSICFYADMITDPEERGELIPGGLGESDGYCFDMFESDEDQAAYLLGRLQEAGRTAAAG
ncbi:MAG: hypothetical protein ACWGOX_01870 [Desulforhopalus sp.]